jgi:xylose isomerase
MSDHRQLLTSGTPRELALVVYTILEGRRVQHRRHDVRRQDPSHQHQPRGPLPRSTSFHAHIGGLDTLARALLAAEKVVNDGKFEAATRQRYAGWERDLGQKILAGKLSLADLSKQVLDTNLEPRPKSGRQEFLETSPTAYL